jgi:hypothetical protein
MATLYSNAAKPSVLEALDLAALDEMEVNEFYKQDQANCDCVVEDFSDDWIRSVSSSCGEQSKNTATKSTTEKEEESGFCVFGDPSGFDDSWLRGD